MKLLFVPMLCSYSSDHKLNLSLDCQRLDLPMYDPDLHPSLCHMESNKGNEVKSETKSWKGGFPRKIVTPLRICLFNIKVLAKSFFSPKLILFK